MIYDSFVLNSERVQVDRIQRFSYVRKVIAVKLSKGVSRTYEQIAT